MPSKSVSIILQTVLLLEFAVLISCSFYSYSTCNSTSYLNTANLQCTQCSTNQIANSYQVIPVNCQCAVGYVVGNNNVCNLINSNNCITTTTYYPLYTVTGDVNSGVSSAACSPCDSSAYANSNATGCVPCGTGMTYSPTQGCICNNSTLTFIRSDLGCFSATLTPPATSSNYYSQLKYLFPACASFSDYLSCSQLSNLCAYSKGDMNTPECSFFPTNSLTSYLYANSGGFSLTASNQLSLTMKLISYLPTGNYLGEKTLQIGDLMRCGTPPNTDVAFTLGSNFQTTCSYDFNNLITLMQSKKYQGKVYQILILGDGSTYYDVPVNMPGSSQSIKRFYLEDSYTSSTSISVLSGFTLSFTLDNNGFLTLPQFNPTYTTLPTQAGSGIVSSQSILSLSYAVLYSSSLTTFWTGALASFITISIVALVHAIIKTYIGYRNRKSPLLFFLNLMGTYSLWLFYYLLFMTGYWFLFTKTTSSPYLFLPSSDTTFYGAFYALVAIMVIFRLIWAIIDKSDKLNTEVFLINWERDQLKNSWRQIFIVGSLANFYTNRTISLFWMLAILLFFMNGVGWQKLAAQTTSTNTTVIFYSLTPQNRLLLYFIACAVFLAVGIIFKILRRLSVLVWPYPFEDFVDYCSVTNISFLFVKKRTPHAFYLHASMPDRTEVTYKKINEAIRRGMQKNRSIANELPSLDSLKLYTIYLSRDIEQKHTQMLKKIQDQDHSRRMKYTKQTAKKQKSNHREEFIETRLKPNLQTMASKQNDTRRKSMLQNFCGIPPVDLRDDGALRRNSAVFFDDQLQLVNEVFPNGNEFQEIHTLIVIFLGWVTITNSCPVAAFLTYFLDEYLIKGWISYSCRNNLEQMTKVKRGFMM